MLSIRGFSLLKCFMAVVCLGGIACRRAPAAEVLGVKYPPVVFYAMGDVPYTPEEDGILPGQIAALPEDGRFMIHVGDIKGGGTPCDEEVYIKVASMLAKSKLPAFIVPGDNEWNDCTDPDQAWEFWTNHFTRFDLKWKHGLQVERQKNRDENFSFVEEGVLFVGINLVGGRFHDPAEWKKRLQDDIRWVETRIGLVQEDIHCIVLMGHATPTPNHDEFFNPLVTLMEKVKQPLLYLHGDGHRWIHDQPFGTPWITRVQVDAGGIAPPLKVTVTNDKEMPFVFDRRKQD